MNETANLTPACRDGCGACCTAPSISSPIPGMPMGKPAGVRCAQLDDDQRCRIFGHPERPPVCASLQPSDEMCGRSRTDAMLFLSTLDRLTAPSPPTPLPHAGEGSEVSRYATFKL